MQSTPTSQRVVIDAHLDDSVIRGTLTEPSGARREFHGWLELNAAIEAALARVPRDRTRYEQSSVGENR